MADQLRINLGRNDLSAESGWNLFSKGDTLVNPTTTLNNVVEVTVTNSGDTTWNVVDLDNITGLTIQQPVGAGLYADSIWKTCLAGTISAVTGGGAVNAAIYLRSLKANTQYTVTFSANSGSITGRDPTSLAARIGGTQGTIATVNPENNLTLENSITFTTDGTGDVDLEFFGAADATQLYYLPTYFIIEGDFPYQRAVILVETDDSFQLSDTGVNVQVGNGGNNVTAIELVSGSYKVAQTNVTIVDDENVTFDVVQDKLPFGTLQLEVTIDGVVYSRPVTLNPDTNNAYVTVSDPVFDDTNAVSVLDNVPGSSPTPQNGQQLEIRDSTGTVSLAANGLYTVSSASTASFQVRRWINTAIGWGDLVTITLTLSSSVIQTQRSNIVASGKQAIITQQVVAGPILANKSNVSVRTFTFSQPIELPQPDVAAKKESVVVDTKNSTIQKKSPSWVIVEPKT